jgi:hypothetical protein
VPRLRVEIGELARAGLRHAIVDPARLGEIERAIDFYLRLDPVADARPCAAFASRQMWIKGCFVGRDVRLLIEIVEDRIIVWSAKLVRD